MKPLYKNSLPMGAKIPFEDIHPLPEILLTNYWKES